MYDVSLSTAHKIVSKCIEFLLSLAPRYMTFPKNDEEKVKLSDEFKQIADFPNVIGCIVGTSIPITTPVKKIKSTYVNRHDTPAITLQGICDYRKCFLDVFTGIPGKIHDSRVLKLSHISKQLPNICNKKYHILGDSAFPIREWLMVPYRDYGSLEESQINFNKRFSATRVKIEKAFGLLKGRFRQLIRIDMNKIDRISKFMISCCVLHNLCIINCDDTIIQLHNSIDNIDDTPTTENEEQLRKLGELKKESIRMKLN